VRSLLAIGSLPLIFATLAAGGVGFPVPEDLVLISLGALVHQDIVPLAAAGAVAAAGVLTGDLLLFMSARRLGPAALERASFQKLLPPERRGRIQTLLEQHGPALILGARQVVGVRAAVFAVAGIEQMPLRRFLFWDVLALCISAPIMIGVGFLFSAHIDRVRRGVAEAEHYMLLAVIAAAIFAVTWLAWRSRHPRPAGQAAAQ
jgi:membrane protein DedA with SNARE-associated domain